MVPRICDLVDAIKTGAGRSQEAQLAETRRYGDGSAFGAPKGH